MLAELFLGSTNAPNYVREANVCPIKNGLYAATASPGSTGNDPDLTGQTARCWTRKKHYFCLYVFDIQKLSHHQDAQEVTRTRQL